VKVSEVLERIAAGEKTAVLCKSVGVGEKRFRAGLKAAGYEFDNSSKVWNYVKEGPEPLEKDILDFVEGGVAASNVKSNSPKVHLDVKYNSHPIHTDMKDNAHEGEKHMKHNSHMVHMPFTQAEIEVLKELAMERIGGNIQTPTDPLYERVEALPNDKKVRKTIVISESVANALDKFCSKKKSINKSDVIALALMDFIERYQD
jgi:hypothetical protein